MITSTCACGLPGVLGALASAVAKFALDQVHRNRVLALVSLQDSLWAHLVAMIALFLVKLALDAWAVQRLVAAMQRLGSVVSTSMTSSIGFVAAGFLGWLLFGDSIDGEWLCGTALIVAGMVLLARETKHSKKGKED